MLSLKIKQSNVRGRADFCHAMKSQIKAQFFSVVTIVTFTNIQQTFCKRCKCFVAMLEFRTENLA